MKIGNQEIIGTGSFKMQNMPDDLFDLDGKVSFVGTWDNGLNISEGDKVSLYLDDSSEHFETTIKKIIDIAQDELSFVPGHIRHVSHNEAEMQKLGRGRIF
jgi:hypothetical protein